MNENNIKTRFLKMWGIVLSMFGILFMACVFSGCSFKYFDPQYYEFKRLCKEVEKDNTIYDDNLYNLFLKAKQKISFYNGRKFYDETTKQEFLVDNFDIKFDSQEISNRLSKTIYKLLYNEEEFYRYSAYNYHYSGLFLKGDEGAGWYIDFDNEILQCKPKVSF
ncbi:hypothetical protein [Helicobacter bilis]|uniref:hypothetical protein n=1 Tax=Helicobacter bilis TaxID=37372 RepID=UPI00051CF5A8|nr:hypothetical protein [Helicobacter bilis]TLE07331.1 hypothetical protein LS78_009835 [Helicobacter bilis]